MPVGGAHSFAGRHRQARAGYRISLAVLISLLAGESLQDAAANGDTRTISFHHIHTKEDLTVTYKRNGRYDDEALRKINWQLRDWRRDEATTMDPRLIDAVWEVYREVGGKEPINIISAYRSPATNAMLRARSNGVAEVSQHMHGNAMDFMIPGVPLENLRAAVLRLQRGGVGFYPSSGSPFVHMDVGSVRHWPRMTHDQLARVFPDGRTVHIPSDGRPLAGYALAMADVQRHGSKPSSVSLAAARSNDVIESEQSQTAASRNFLTALFGKVTKEEDDDDQPATTAGTKPSNTKPTVLALAAAAPEKPAAVRLPQPRPATLQVASAAMLPSLPRPAQARATPAALSANDVIKVRGYWQGVPDSGSPLAALALARAGNNDRAPAELALAYAGQAEIGPSERPLPMGAALARVTASRDGTVAAKGGTLPNHTIDNPWMRAMVLAPSAAHFMSVSLFGAPDYTRLTPMIEKPAAAVMMTFSDNPHLGMNAERFSGEAVVFVATVTFAPQRSAALQ